MPSPPFLACVPLVSGWSPKKILGARALLVPFPPPSLLLSSLYSHPSPFILTAYISTAFVTRLRNNPLARHRKISGGGPADYIAGFMNKKMERRISTEFISSIMKKHDRSLPLLILT